MNSTLSAWPLTVKCGLVLLVGTYLYDAGLRLYFTLTGSMSAFQPELLVANLVNVGAPLIAIIAIALRRKWGRFLYLLPLSYLAYQTFVFVPSLTMRSPFADLEPVTILGLMIAGVLLLFLPPSQHWFAARAKE